MILEILQEINESRTESGRGSEKGREKYASKEGTKEKKIKSRKSRVKVYDTIKAALDSAAPYGHIFSTKAADRLYVITRPQWGKKSTAGGNTRVAKGFTPGAATPSASWPSIKGHAVRTAIKHGKISSSRLKKKYGAGTERSEERRYAGKTSKRKGGGKTNEAQEANPWAICHAELGKEKTDKFERCVMKVKAKHGIKDWTEFKRKLSYVKEGSGGAKALQRKGKAQRPLRVAPGATIQEPTARAKLRGAPGGGEIQHGGLGRSQIRTSRALQKAHTEHEGPSLREKLAHLKEAMPASQKKQTGTSVFRKSEDPAKAGGQGSQGTGNLPGKGVKRRKDVAAALRTSTEYEGPSLSETAAYIAEKNKGGWIQGAQADIERRGTEGKCTPITKPGCTGRAKALAKTFKKMAKKRDKDIVSKEEKKAKGK